VHRQCCSDIWDNIRQPSLARWFHIRSVLEFPQLAPRVRRNSCYLPQKPPWRYDRREFRSDSARRLIEIGSESQSIRLIETTGIRRRYVTPSHCWDQEHRRPLCTTKKNLSRHFQEIRFEELPRTFQHAVVFTRNIKVQYLWIDSLCIVQGDTNDWEKESASMG
jgi:hypothetical protein